MAPNVAGTAKTGSPATKTAPNVAGTGKMRIFAQNLSSMKYKSLLVFSVLLAAIAVSCSKENASDVKFTGIQVEVGEIDSREPRLLVLNEGVYPGASTLDLLDFGTKTYSADVFGQANPDVVQGIGSTGNDIAFIGGKIWCLMNSSNQVAVLNANTLKLEKVLDIQSPRHIDADDTHAYITSYGAAVYGAESVNGYLYRVDLSNYSYEKLEVGPQPEGVVQHRNYVYVANSGGYNAVKDNRIMVVKKDGFKVDKTIKLPVSNLNMLFEDEDILWISTYDTYGPAPDYAFEAAAGLYSIAYDGTGFKAVEGVSPTFTAMCRDCMYAFTYDTFNIVSTESVKSIPLAGTAFEGIYPGGMVVTSKPDNSNGDIIVSTAQYTGPSTLICADQNLKLKWKLEIGTGAGHLLLY